MTSFGKIPVEGPDAALSSTASARGRSTFPGRDSCTRRLLTRAAEKNATLTSTRPDETALHPGSCPARRLHCEFWRGLERHHDEAAVRHCRCDGGRGGLPLMGLEGADVLLPVRRTISSNTTYSLRHAREIEIGMGLARAHRRDLCRANWDGRSTSDRPGCTCFPKPSSRQGRIAGLKPCGIHAMNSCRLEKAFFGISGHDYPQTRSRSRSRGSASP